MQNDLSQAIIKSEEASRNVSRVSADTVPYQHDAVYYLQDIIILVSALFNGRLWSLIASLDREHVISDSSALSRTIKRSPSSPR
jgi:hypothetical protein